MLLNSYSKLFSSCFLLITLALFFHACEKDNSIAPQNQENTSIFKTHSINNTQHLQAPDLGNGTYTATGAQGTVIEINDALVDTKGNQIRGTIDIELIEIYSVDDMILHRKQTMADYDGQKRILESGGEIFIKISQNGKELSVAENKSLKVMLPTENTGGPKEEMELYYGEETGPQIIWKPTGEKVAVITSNTLTRSDVSYYLSLIQGTLGWINIDRIYSAGGAPVECVQVVIDCEEFCEINEDNSVAAIHVSGVNSAFELTYAGNNTFELCGIQGEGALPLGGITVTFIVAIDCGDENIHVAVVTATITAGFHIEVVKCNDIEVMDPEQFADVLSTL